MNQQIVAGLHLNNRAQTVALSYLKNGWSVIPVRAGGKVPLIDWKPFTQRKATELEIIEWFKKDCNIGIVTGQISNLIVVDLDGQEGIDEAKRLGLTSSLTVITGKGRHLYYKWQPNIQNAVRIKLGIDIRSDNGFVVAPISVSESGKRYRWINPLNAHFVNCLLPLPLMFMKDQKSVTEHTVGKEEGWIAKALEEMKDGNIDNTLTSVLGRLRHDGYDSSDARILLLPHAERAGATPGHLEEKIRNLWSRYEAKPMSRVSLASNSSMVIHSPTNPDSIKGFELSHLERSNDKGLETGYSRLDSLLWGGLKSSRLFTIAARTGTGKTNFLIGIARTVCEAGKKVLIFSTETPYTELWSRYINTLGDATRFNQHQLYVCDSFAPNLEKVEEIINEIKPDLFMFDHVNHIGEDHIEVANFMQGLNWLRRKYDCAGIVTAQLNRSADWIDLKTGEKVLPRMSMIKSSGTIEQASSRVLLLSETRVTPEGTEISGNLDKNDNGPKGLCHFILQAKPYKMVGL